MSQTWAMPVAKASMVATGMGLRGCPGPGFGRAASVGALLRDLALLAPLLFLVLMTPLA